MYQKAAEERGDQQGNKDNESNPTKYQKGRLSLIPANSAA
jgi:hypothetical protein